MTYTEASQWLNELVARVVHEWVMLQALNPSMKVHLYWRPSNGDIPGDLCASYRAPGEKFSLACAEEIPRDADMARATRWINDQSQSLGILPVGEQ